MIQTIVIWVVLTSINLENDESPAGFEVRSGLLLFDQFALEHSTSKALCLLYVTIFAVNCSRFLDEFPPLVRVAKQSPGFLELKVILTIKGRVFGKLLSHKVDKSTLLYS